jgi:hypothetical protein
MNIKHHWRRWLLAAGLAIGLGSGLAYAANECWDCYPCTCEPDGSYGSCCTWYEC